MGTDVRWRLLGDVGVTIGGSRVEISGQRTRAVAAYLLLHQGERVSNEALVDALWGEHPPKTARNSVQRFVADLRRVLGVASDRVTTVDGAYRLEVAAGDRVDAGEVAEAVTRARALLSRGRPGEALDCIGVGLDQLAGEPLGGIGDTEFGAAARTRLDDVALDALEARLEARLALGQFTDVAAEARALADRYPYREMFWAHLMTALYGGGRQHEALQAFQELRQRLVDDLGVVPSAALVDLERRILDHDVELPADVSELPATPAPAGRLAVPATKFFGRERELDLTESQLTADEGALVTIVGPGGSGKTRLAARIVSRVEGRFEGGVVTVELDGITEPERVAPVVASAFGLKSVADPVAELVEHLNARRLLLVLDNAELLVDAVASLALSLMSSAPGLRILVTSREALGVSAEHRIDLAGLDLDVPALRSATPAAALFTERARRQVARFEPDEHVDRICSLVGGLPLAIELAARWISSLTTAQIADRLENDVGLLETDAPDVPERQRTMAGVLDASWGRLDRSHAELGSDLSIFVGGFDLEAAHAVCGASPLALQRLVARSLLSWLPGGRLEMHELIRQHAWSRLTDERRTSLRAAHRAHYLSRVGDGDATFLGPDPAAFIAWLESDFDNVVMAWNSAIDSHDREAMNVAAETLTEFALATGRDVEVAALLDRAASLGPDLFSATMYERRLRSAWNSDSAIDMEELFLRAQGLASGDLPEEAACRIRLAYDMARHLAEHTGELDRALELTAGARADADAIGDPHNQALLDVSDARAAMMGGRFDEALELYGRAIDVFTASGDAMRASDAIAMTAAAHAEQYQIWEALQADLHALDLRLRRNDPRAIALAQMNTGASYVLVGAWGEAERHTDEAIAITNRLAIDTNGAAYLDCQLAEVRVGQGRRDAAERLFTTGIERLRQQRYMLALRLKLPEWARFLVDEQRWVEAGLVIDEARDGWEQVGGDHFLTLLDGLEARVAAGLGDADRACELAQAAWRNIQQTDGTGHPFPIRTMADCMLALEHNPGTDGLVGEVRAFARTMVKRVAASITAPTYRQTYLTLPEVAYVL